MRPLVSNWTCYLATKVNASRTTTPTLSFDRLRRIQTTLTRRVRDRDRSDLRAVGFAPGQTTQATEPAMVPVRAQFDVQHKFPNMAAARRIEPIEAVRVLDRQSRRYLQLALATDVLQTGDIVPTGVRIDTDRQSATTSTVVRWTTSLPVPDVPTAIGNEDPRWRWGLLSVAHVFANNAAQPAPPRVERQLTCGQGPDMIAGRVIARGQAIGGPDISLIETGLDRLWLSGMLSKPEAPNITPADEPQLLRWIMHGTMGTFLGDGVQYGWRWQTYYPELTIEGLGKLQHVVRYEALEAVADSNPFGPGSSGGLLLAGGIPIGIQVAAMRPDFRVGFAQTFDASLAWLQKHLRATALHIVHAL